jgi:hypothetical protein
VPKEVLNIVDFSGGINKAVDKRDLEPNEIVLSNGLVSYHPGKLTLNGAFEQIDGMTEHSGSYSSNYISEGIPNLYGLFPEYAFRVFGHTVCTNSASEGTFVSIQYPGTDRATHSLEVGAALNIIHATLNGNDVSAIYGTTIIVSEIVSRNSFKATNAGDIGANTIIFYVLNAQYDENDPLKSIPSTNYQSNRFFLKAAQYGKFGFYSIGTSKYWYGAVDELVPNVFGNDSWFFDTKYLWDFKQDSMGHVDENLISSTRVLDAFYDDGAFRLLLDPPTRWRNGRCKRPVGLYSIDSPRTHFDVNSINAYNINRGLYAVRSHCLAPHEYHHALTDSLTAPDEMNYKGAGLIEYNASNTSLSNMAADANLPGELYNSTTDVNQFSVQVSTSGSGDWQAASGNIHSVLGFGISLLYDDINNPSESNVSDLTTADGTTTTVTLNSSNDTSLYLYMLIHSGENLFNEYHQGIINGDISQTHAVSEFRGSGFNNGESNFKCWNPRIVGANVWMTSNDEGKLEEPVYLATFNFNGNDDGFGRSISHDGITAGANWQTTDVGVNTIHQMIIIPTIPVLPYSLRNGYEYNENIHAWYKTSAIVNRRLYAGNVSYYDKQPSGIDNEESPSLFPDRILRSPVNKFDILPASSFIDFVLHDSQDIVKLVAFGQKLLVYKHDDLYVLDCSGEVERLEATHKGMGLPLPTQVCVTPNAVYWVNTQGVFGYNNEDPPSNLTSTKISVSEWLDKIYNIHISIEYEPQNNMLMVFSKYKEFDSVTEVTNKYLFMINLNSGSIFFKSQPSTPFISEYSKGLIFNNTLYLSGQHMASDEILSIQKTTDGISGTFAYGVVSFTISNTSHPQSLGGTNNKYLYVRKGTTWTVVNGNYTLSEIHGTVGGIVVDTEQVLNAPNVSTNTEYIHDFLYFETQNKWYVTTKAKQNGTAYNLNAATISGYGSTFWGLSNTNTDEPSALGDIQDFEVVFNKAGVNDIPPVFTVFTNRLGQSSSGISYTFDMVCDLEGTNANVINRSITYTTSGNPSLLYEAASSSNYSSDSDSSANNVTNSNALTVNLHEFLQENFLSNGNYGEKFTDYFTFSSVSTDSGGTVTGTAGLKYFTMTARTDTSQNLMLVNLTSSIDSGIGYTLVKWNGETSSENTIALLETKDYDFNQPNVRKKIYKAYITYKASAGIKVYYQANQSGTWTLADVKDSTTDNTLLTSTEYTRGEVSFGTGGNNVFSFALKFESANIVKTFDVNDISYIFRQKRPK